MIHRHLHHHLGPVCHPYAVLAAHAIYGNDFRKNHHLLRRTTITSGDQGIIIIRIKRIIIIIEKKQ
jgi:hypothetical protein